MQPRSEQPEIRVDRVGAEQVPVVVVEHFSPAPDRLIAEAETLDFTAMGEFYPGVRAPVTPAYFEGLNAILAPVMRQVFGARERIEFGRALYSLAVTSPGELTLAQRIPHIDTVEPGRIAILHYLSHAAHGGTAFYRHRSTGFETIDAVRHRPYLDALRVDFDAQGEPLPAYIQGDTAIFEQTARYDAVFNRALIYPSNLLHCAVLPDPAALASDVRKGRLTVASFLTIC